MTEAEWLAATDPEQMLASLRGQASATDRKLRLFACACARLVMRFPCDSRAWTAIETAERFADGGETDEHLAAAGEAAVERLRDMVEDVGHVDDGSNAVVRAAEATCIRRALHVARVAARVASEAATAARGTATGKATRQRLAALLTCILRRCTARAVDRAWLAWNDGTARRLAESAYMKRSLPEGTLEAARLALVADALEDAGCTDGELPGHLRGPGLHVRGCWALDLVLAKS
jgi:hypothetical protein